MCKWFCENIGYLEIGTNTGQFDVSTKALIPHKVVAIGRDGIGSQWVPRMSLGVNGLTAEEEYKNRLLRWVIDIDHRSHPHERYESDGTGGVGQGGSTATGDPPTLSA